MRIEYATEKIAASSGAEISRQRPARAFHWHKKLMSIFMIAINICAKGYKNNHTPHLFQTDDGKSRVFFSGTPPIWPASVTQAENSARLRSAEAAMCCILDNCLKKLTSGRQANCFFRAILEFW